MLFLTSRSGNPQRCIRVTALHAAKRLKCGVNTVDLLQMPRNQDFWFDGGSLAVGERSAVQNVRDDLDGDGKMFPDGLSQEFRRGCYHIRKLEDRLHTPAKPAKKLFRISAAVVQDNPFAVHSSIQDDRAHEGKKIHPGGRKNMDDFCAPDGLQYGCAVQQRTYESAYVGNLLQRANPSGKRTIAGEEYNPVTILEEEFLQQPGLDCHPTVWRR